MSRSVRRGGCSCKDDPHGPRYHLACLQDPSTSAGTWDHFHCGCDGPAPLGSTGPVAGLFFRELPGDAGSMLVPPVYASAPFVGVDVVGSPYARGMARTSESPAPPRVSAPDVPPVLDLATPRRSADLIAARIELSGAVDLAYAMLEQCRVSADADTVDLTSATLLDVEISGARIASLRMRDTNVRRLRISGGRIGTLDLSEARISELELNDVRVEYLNLGGAKVSDLEVSGCAIRTIDMPLSTLTRVRFTATSSDEVDPRGMRAKDVDLRGLDASAYLDANSLRGATFTSFQMQQLAPMFAVSLGIQIKD